MQIFSLMQDESKKKKYKNRIFWCVVLLLFSMQMQVSGVTVEPLRQDAVYNEGSAQSDAANYQLPPETDIEYNEVPVDSMTGEISQSAGDLYAGLIGISQNVYYEKETGLYRFIVNEQAQKYITCNVADNMVVNGEVSLFIEDNLVHTLYRNNSKLEKIDTEAISRPGSYTLFVGDERILSFTIVGEYDAISTFAVPEGFYVTEVVKDGEMVHYDSSVVDMTGEGEYSVSYTCDSNKMSYTFRTIVDHTPPVLALSAVDEDGKARGAVDISDLEEGATLTVIHDGEEIVPDGTQLIQNGNYKLIVTDRAGNVTNYNFLIMLYFNMSSIAFFVLIILVFLGVAAYIIISGKRIRVF